MCALAFHLRSRSSIRKLFSTLLMLLRPINIIKSLLQFWLQMTLQMRSFSTLPFMFVNILMTPPQAVEGVHHQKIHADRLLAQYNMTQCIWGKIFLTCAKLVGC